MLITPILDFIWSVLSPAINQIPTITLPSNPWTNTFIDFVRMAFWMLPVQTFLEIMTIVFALWVLRVVVAFFKTLWGMLPLV